MQRHPALQPLSRDHHGTLVQARRLRQAAGGDEAQRREAVARLREDWDEEVLSHFRDEETRLTPLIPHPEEARRLADDHAILRALAQALFDEAAEGRHDPDRIRLLAQHFEEHVRWEERELFPLIERCADPADLARLTWAARNGGGA